MKFTILINQHAIDQKGLTDSTDLIDWAIMDYIQKWLTSPKAQRMGRKVWINYKHIIKEMPLLGLKAKSSISNRITKLTELGLLSTEKDDSCRLFADLTELAHEVISFHEGSQDCTGVPENERGVHYEERGVQNQERGVPENEHTTNQHLTNQYKQTTKSKEAPEGLNQSAWNDWIEYRKEIKKKYKSKMSTQKAMNQLAELSKPQQRACIDHSIANGYQGFFVEKFTGENNGNNQHAETPAERINRQGREYDEKMRQRQNAMDMGAYETRISGTLD